MGPKITAIKQLELLVREWIACKLILFALWIAPKEMALVMGKALMLGSNELIQNMFYREK